MPPPSHGYLQKSAFALLCLRISPHKSLVQYLFLDGGLVDDNGLQVLSLGHLGLELSDDGRDVELVLWLHASVFVVQVAVPHGKNAYC